MTPIADILDAATLTETGLAATIPADWMQGRTAYGGISSALALHAAQQCEPDLPPLRSAQIAFIGPLAGEVTVSATKLRRGRYAAFIQSDVASAAGLGLRATFVFMADQPSTIAYADDVTTDRAPPPADAALYTGPDEFFTGNFNFLDIRDDSVGAAEFLRWTRLRARQGLDPMTELMAVADGLPPAAFKLFGKGAQVPVSSLTWIVNLLTPSPATRDGWWLLGARTGFAKNGCSSQEMSVWNADGALIARGMQSVAIFG